MMTLELDRPHTLIVNAFYSGNQSRRELWMRASERVRAWMRANGYSPENEAERSRIELLRLRKKTERL